MAERKDWRKSQQIKAEARALGKTFAIVLTGATVLVSIAALTKARK